MKLNRLLPCLAATIAGLLVPLTVVHGQTTTTLATGSITCKMLSWDPVTEQPTTPTSTFDQAALQKHVVVGDTGATVVSYGVLSRWGTDAEVMYSILIGDLIPVGTTVAPISGSFLGYDAGSWYIDYDELGQLTFKLDGKGRLTVTGTSFAAPPSRFISVVSPAPIPFFGTCTWNLKGTV